MTPLTGPEQLLAHLRSVLCSRLGASLAVVLLALAIPGSAGEAPPSCPSARVVCAHRGMGESDASAGYPENTLPSFLAAVDAGASMIELDVMRSSDGELVVIHDDAVDRTTDGTGCVRAMTADALRKLDAGHGTPMRGRGLRIPTLDEVLEAVGVELNVEIKVRRAPGCPADGGAELAGAVVRALRRDPRQRRVIVSSFDVEVLDAVRRLEPERYIGWLSIWSGDADEARAHRFDALHLLHWAATPAAIEHAHAQGLDVNVWTVDEPGTMESLLRAGVDMIITNSPSRLGEARAGQCARAGSSRGPLRAAAGPALATARTAAF